MSCPSVPASPEPESRAEATNSLVEQILTMSPVGIAVIDDAGHFLQVNPAYCNLYGYPPGDLLGLPFTLVFPPSQQAQMMALHQAFVAGTADMRGEWPVVRQDGSVINVRVDSAKVRHESGRICRLAYVVDITPHKRMEQVLQASRQFLDSVLDALASHVCVIDGAGIILTVNRAWRDFAALQGGQADDLFEGASYLAVCETAAQSGAAEAHDAAAFLGRLKQVLAGELIQFHFEYPCHSPGQQRWFVARVARIADSQPTRIVVAHDDVTVVKLAQETLRESEALMLDLAASIPGAMFRLANRDEAGWRFEYLSPGVQTLFEISPHAACADPKALWAMVLPEDRDAHDASAREALRSAAAWEHEYRVRTPGGAEKWIHAKAAPKPDVDGAIVWTGVFTDVSERKRVEAVLKASEETYRTLFETVPQGVVYHDRTGRITSANPAALRILGLSIDQLQSRASVDPRWHAIHEDGSPFPGDQHPAMQALQTGQPVRDVVMGLAMPARDVTWIQITAMPMFRQGRLSEVYASFEDITQRVQLGRDLHVQASTDYLTGAANRRSLMARLAVEHQRVQRHATVQCSVLALDLDHFKQVNDAWGHAAGDAVLVHLTQLMRQETRALDVVGRSGGEEFTLLLPDTALAEALALAERLRARVARTPAMHGQTPIAVSVSIGASMIRPDDATPDAVLGRADRALYDAKHAGRDQVRAL